MNSRGITSLVYIVVGIILVIVIISAVSALRGKPNPLTEVTNRAANVVTSGAGFDFDENSPGYDNYKKLLQGCPFKDCIPSIDNPKFETVSEADTWLLGEDIVFSLDYKGEARVLDEVAGEARAYPQRILNWHEIVNDTVAGDPILISFCPLCGSALAFDSRVDGQALEFGVSGKLLNDNLVMYDRNTETLWQQITAEAIVGEFFGKKLKQISMDTMRWSQFKEQFPDGKVLSRETGFSRNYDRYPYGTYEQDSSVLFPIEGGVDTTIHPKTVVYGIEVNGEFKAYQEDKIKAEGNVKDKVGGVSIQVSYKNGNISVENLDNGDEIIATRLFWFAWIAFNPETELY